MLSDNLDKFIFQKLQQLHELGIDVAGLEMDHFAYQASSTEDYERLLEEAKALGELVREPVLNGRRVAVLKLKAPIKYEDYELTAFEVVEPKPGQVTESRLDHIEFVLKRSFQKFLDLYPDLSWDKSSLDRPDFPHLVMRFADGTGVKFHLGNILN